MHNLDSETIKLIQWMTGPPPSHPEFVGEPIEPTRLDALALGDLWPYAHAVELRDADGPSQRVAAIRRRVPSSP